MSVSPRILAVVPLLLTACVQDRDLLAPVAEARAGIAAEDAQPSVYAALGMAAVAADLCGYSLEDWQAMGTEPPALAEDVAAWFGVDEPAQMRVYAARGQYDLSWNGGRAFGQDVTLKVSVATAMSSFTVTLTELSEATVDTGGDTGAVEDDAEVLASALLATSRCGGTGPQVVGNFDFPVSGDYAWDITLAGAEGDDGLAYAPDALLPSRGTLAWGGVASYGRASIETDDASTISQDRWPGTASGRGWESSVELVLSD